MKSIGRGNGPIELATWCDLISSESKSKSLESDGLRRGMGVFWVQRCLIGMKIEEW